MNKNLTLPISDQRQIQNLDINDFVLLSGIIYTARDAAHRRLEEMIESGQKLPIPLNNQGIYYMGPSPARPGNVVGSAGPTTSSRMDSFTPLLLELGLKITLGKGARSEMVVESIKKNKAVYLGTIGGAGAYLANCITSMECVAFPEFGPEAIYKLEIKNFPSIVLVK